MATFLTEIYFLTKLFGLTGLQKFKTTSQISSLKWHWVAARTPKILDLILFRNSLALSLLEMAGKFTRTGGGLLTDGSKGIAISNSMQSADVVGEVRGQSKGQQSTKLSSLLKILLVWVFTPRFVVTIYEK